ncbi:MAG: ACP S-malonyltransferase [Gammaproteobacteria bacterium]
MTDNNKTFAMLFPGQGSQHPGMLNELAQQHSVIKRTFEEASDLLGYDMWTLCQDDPQKQLNQTAYTQPVLLTAGVAVYRAWRKQQGGTPHYLTGHSLGEYTALVCANAISFEEGVQLVADRGHYMQGAVPAGKGAMAAIIGLDNEAVIQLCKTHQEGQVLMPANYNAHGQVVIAGEIAAVERAVQHAKAAGAKLAKMLPVSVPSHCTLMQSASGQLAKRLGEIHLQAPKISVVNNVDVAVVTEPALIKDALVRQLANPVRWVEVIEYLLSKHVTHFIECGPGKVLQGLNRRISQAIENGGLQDVASFDSALASVK